MSTSVVSIRQGPDCHGAQRRTGWATWLGLAAAIGSGCGPASAQPGSAETEAVDEVDRALETAPSPVELLTGGMQAYIDAVASEPRRWEGQRVPWPTAWARPRGVAVRTSTEWDVTFHQPHAAIDDDLASRWVDAFDTAYALLARDGWPLAPADGGRGGGDGLDVYVVPEIEGDEAADPALEPEPGARSRSPRTTDVRMDVPLFPAALDGAVVHVVLDDDVPADRALPCAIQLAAEAGLFAADPAEAASLRHATGAWLAWFYSGIAGCDEDALVRQQRASYRALIGPDPRDAEGGAIFLAAIAQRHDAHGTTFLRDVWQLARQRTRDDGDLRGEPDVLRVLGQAADLAHDPIDRALEALAVARWFVGAAPRREGCEVALLRTLPEGATVPELGTTSWTRLPRSLRLGPESIEPWGSAYARVDVREAPAGSVLRVWLDGETGTEWSLVAVRLDDQGRERGRTRAPRTRRTRSYVPVELSAGTTEVLLVVTSIPDDDDPREREVDTSRDGEIAAWLHRTGLDADTLLPSGRAFRLLVDRGP